MSNNSFFFSNCFRIVKNFLSTSYEIDVKRKTTSFYDFISRAFSYMFNQIIFFTS